MDAMNISARLLPGGQDPHRCVNKNNDLKNYERNVQRRKNKTERVLSKHRNPIRLIDTQIWRILSRIVIWRIIKNGVEKIYLCRSCVILNRLQLEGGFFKYLSLQD